MCQYCQVNEDNEGIAGPIMFDEISGFSDFVRFDTRLYGPTLSVSVYLRGGGALLDKEIVVKYCPMCGRKL